MLQEKLLKASPSRAILSPAVARGGLLGTLFLLLVLSSTYDKSGVLFAISGRAISVSLYKVLFIVLLIFYAINYLYKICKRLSRKKVFDQQLYRFIWVFVIAQTIVSLIGSIFTAGKVMLSSEIYYFIQRSSFIIIPLLALRYNIPPKSLLKLFMGAILIHYFFIALQFMIPGAYFLFANLVSDGLRLDNALLYWDGQSLAFIGLQRTANYGAFVCTFGLLMLGFKPKRFPSQLLAYTVVFSSLLISVAAGSRASFIIAFVTLLVFSYKIKIFSKHLTYFWVCAIAGIAIGGFFLLDLNIPRLESFPSIYRFVNPEAEGSNISKRMIMQYSVQMIRQSPIVGWGKQQFSDISYAFGNYSLSTSYIHFYFLSILISSGLIGFILYLALFFRIVKALWRRKEKDYVSVCAMFLGLGAYNFVYDAGSLDVFACFNGIAAYYALRSPKLQMARNASASLVEHYKA